MSFQTFFDALEAGEESPAPAPKTALGPQVPNQFPSLDAGTNRIALIGEAPGADEEQMLKPFVGMSGRFLNELLSRAQIVRERCFVGNVCQFRPPSNDIKKFALDGPEITEGLAQLKLDLAQFNPNVCVLLGKTALWAAMGTKNLRDWRGSLFLSEAFDGRKCLATYHPAACLRQYSWKPLLQFDLKRAKEESFDSLLILPERELLVELPFKELCDKLQWLIDTEATVASDIEGGVEGISCISFATSPSYSFCVPFLKLDGSPYWPKIEEEILWQLVRFVLESPKVKKIWQNGLYDRFVLDFCQGIIVQGNEDDIMLQHWEVYHEFEKKLGFQNSIYTREPFYKFERKTEDQLTFYRYCCRDSATTYECNQEQKRLIRDSAKEHYRFNHECLDILLYAERRGIRYNQDAAKERLGEMEDHVRGYQNELDNIARELGVLDKLIFEDRDILRATLQRICCKKRSQAEPKKEFIERGYWEVLEMLKATEGPLTPEQCGQVSIMCKQSMNTKSAKQFQHFLYTTCKLPTQWKKDPASGEMKVTTDYEALLKLTKAHTHPALRCALELSRLRTRCQMLEVLPYKGRMHCSYNLVGSETGRVTSSKSPLCVPEGRVGTNLQTISDDWDLEDQDHPLAEGLRNLYLADEGCYLGKLDLKGSDGWTIGSYMAMLGDSVMLDDLKFGLKPAQVVAYIIKHGAEQIQKCSRDRAKLRELVSSIKKEDWEYFVSKQLIWGMTYTMGPRKAAERVFVESDGKVNMSESDARSVQAAIFIRYRVREYQNYFQRLINQSTSYPFTLMAPTGSVRKFFGRPTEILGEVVAHVPQVVTTYATLKAAHRLWTDPDNRTGESGMVSDSGSNSERANSGNLPLTNGEQPSLDRSTTALRENRKLLKFLRVEPLHQVHDELLVQWKIEDTDWAIGKIRQWFDNPITVANQTITIPFDGSYGTSWAMDKETKVGEIK